LSDRRQAIREQCSYRRAKPPRAKPARGRQLSSVTQQETIDFIGDYISG